MATSFVLGPFLEPVEPRGILCCTRVFLTSWQSGWHLLVNTNRNRLLSQHASWPSTGDPQRKPRWSSTRHWETHAQRMVPESQAALETSKRLRPLGPDPAPAPPSATQAKLSRLDLATKPTHGAGWSVEMACSNETVCESWWFQCRYTLKNMI